VFSSFRAQVILLVDSFVCDTNSSSQTFTLARQCYNLTVNEHYVMRIYRGQKVNFHVLNLCSIRRLMVRYTPELVWSVLDGEYVLNSGHSARGL
jgi:hypothetical protein